MLYHSLQQGLELGQSWLWKSQSPTLWLSSKAFSGGIPQYISQILNGLKSSQTNPYLESSFEVLSGWGLNYMRAPASGRETSIWGRPGRMRLKGPLWARRKRAGWNARGHPSGSDHPKFLTVVLRSQTLLCRPWRVCVCLGVRSCPCPASLSILLGNNQEKTPSVSWLLNTLFTHREHPAHREHFFPAVILMEIVVSDGERNSGDDWEVPEGELAYLFAQETSWTCHQRSHEKH